MNTIKQIAKTKKTPLFTEIKTLIEQSKQKIAVEINSTITELYWQIGKRIKTDILKNKRAEYGSLHLSNETIQEMIKILKSKNIIINHRFGDGPSWVMRVIRTAGELAGFNSDILLKHSFKRQIYFLPLIENYLDILNNKKRRPKYYDYILEDLVAYWKRRWFEKRIERADVREKVIKFKSQGFSI